VADAVSQGRDALVRVVLVRDDQVKDVPLRAVLIKDAPPVKLGQRAPEVLDHPEQIRRLVVSNLASKVLVHPIRQNHVVQEGPAVLALRVQQVVQVLEQVARQAHAVPLNLVHPQPRGLAMHDHVPQEKYQENRVQALRAMIGSRVVHPRMSPNLVLPSHHVAGVDS
jgi:hypothetical protein